MATLAIFFIALGLLMLFAFVADVKIIGFKNAWKQHYYYLILSVFVICVWGFILRDSLSDSGGPSYRCAICGKTTGLRQITNTHGDYYWYCSEHYADAWQYYYGR